MSKQSAAWSTHPRHLHPEPDTELPSVLMQKIAEQPTRLGAIEFWRDVNGLLYERELFFLDDIKAPTLFFQIAALPGAARELPESERLMRGTVEEEIVWANSLGDL